MWMGGHPWEIALKQASPLSDAGLLRTIIPPGGISMDGPIGQQLQLEVKLTSSKTSFGITFDQRTTTVLPKKPGIVSLGTAQDRRDIGPITFKVYDISTQFPKISTTG